MPNIGPTPLATVRHANSGLDALATSSTRLTGYETDAYDIAGHTSAPLHDVIVSAKFVVASSGLTASQIDLWAIPALNDTPTWPGPFDGTASSATVNHAGQLQGYGRLLRSWTTTTTGSLAYECSVSLAEAFGGILPDQVVFFVAHSTGANLAGSNSNWIDLTPLVVSG
jgi:hypothetical protein